MDKLQIKMCLRVQKQNVNLNTMSLRSLTHLTLIHDNNIPLKRSERIREKICKYSPLPDGKSNVSLVLDKGSGINKMYTKEEMDVIEILYNFKEYIE